MISEKQKENNVGCVIVLYNPDIILLNKVLVNISSQVKDVILVDNSPSTAEEHNYLDSISNNITYIPLGENLGIAEAQNIGLSYLSESDFVLFLDQDSVPTGNFVEILVSSYEFLEHRGIVVGGVGARPFNVRENKKYEGSLIKGKIISDNITEVKEIISSSSLIRMKNFNEIGGMDAELFIDGVDHEWCWRATHLKQMRFFIIESVLLEHQLGEGDRRFIFKKIAIPTPFRTYYQFRNYFKLVKRNYVPIYWKVSNGIKYFIKYFYYPLFISPKIEYFKRINKGIKDGVFSK